jgi:hypothetical protein
VNPDIALRGDCGYDFPSGVVKESYLTSPDRHRTRNGAIGVFGMFAVVRLVPLLAAHHQPGALVTLLVAALVVGATVFFKRNKL